MVKNPCIKICQQNDDGVCIGCFRTNDEIVNWYDFSDLKQLKVRQDAIKRKSEARGGGDYYGFPG